MSSESGKTQIFSKSLSQTDINVRLAVPIKSLDAFEIPEGEFKAEFKAIDNEGKPWRFRLTKSRNDARPNPVLSAGWLAYVRQKHLQKNDKLFLHVELKGTEKRYRIQALRKAFMMMGLQFWVDVENLKEDVKRVPSMKVLP